MTFKSGFISIIGCPNVGKSTLLNKLVGQKIAIVSSSPQTTRNKITGVLTRADYQMVFMDTPGVASPKNRLGEYMQNIAFDALNEVEAILFLIDPIHGMRERDKELLVRVKKAKAPKIGVINKADATSMDRMDEVRAFLKYENCFDHIVSTSALEGDGVSALEKLLTEYLVEGPQYFPDDMVTDQPERVVCAEMIREKTLQFLREEIPHGIGVSMDKMEKRETGDFMDIWATIYCERASHKGMIIGKQGSMLKKIGQTARIDIEWMLGLRVNLQLWVKVKEDWRNSASTMRELGFE